MELQGFQIIISTIIIISGWFINNLLNRSHEIAKKRIDLRLEMLHSLLPVYRSLVKSKHPFKDDKELNQKIENSFILVQLYGFQKELSLFIKFKNALESADTEKTTKYLNDLMGLYKIEIRSELKLPKVEYH